MRSGHAHDVVPFEDVRIIEPTIDASGRVIRFSSRPSSDVRPAGRLAFAHGAPHAT